MTHTSPKCSADPAGTYVPFTATWKDEPCESHLYQARKNELRAVPRWKDESRFRGDLSRDCGDPASPTPCVQQEKEDVRLEWQLRAMAVGS